MVAKCGVNGVPFAGRRPVRSSITLAEIRAGNTNLGPEEPPTVQETGLNCQSLNGGFSSPLNGSIHAPTTPSLPPSMSQCYQPQNLPPPMSQTYEPPLPSLPPASPNYQKAASLNNSLPPLNLPPLTSQSFQPPLPLHPQPPGSPHLPPPRSPGAPSSAVRTPCSPKSPPSPVQDSVDPFWGKMGRSSQPRQAAVSDPHLNGENRGSETNSFAQSLHEFEAQRDLMMSPVGARGINTPTEPGPGPGPATRPVYQQKEPDVSGSKIPPPITGINLMSGVKYAGEELGQPAGKRCDQVTQNPASQSRLNDDIKLAKPRERSVPRQQSLQKEFEGHARNPNNFSSDSQNTNLESQRSLDMDEPELMDLQRSSRRDSNSGAVRYRPSTPRIVTPVRFTPTPKLANKGFKSPDVKFNDSKTGPTVAKVAEKNKATEVGEEVKIMSQGPSRNVSDSGISVESNSTPEPDETSGRIITDQMQKIEAQMKKILSTENQKPMLPEPVRVEPSLVFNVETSESASSVNSMVPQLPDSGRPSVDRVVMSGYSTCSEDELKFDEPRVCNGEKSKMETPLQTGSFEAMEEFEEAPEEFDLGITSYSISHPPDIEELEKTPVPEVCENHKFEDTPYRVSPPESQYGTLEHDKKPHLQKSAHQESNGGGFPNAMHSPFMQDPHSLFNPIGMPNMMAGMFEASFPTFPNMFDQPFSQQDMFGAPFHPIPASAMPVSAPSQMQKATNTARASGERIIPIQVVKSNSADLAPQKPQVQSFSQVQKQGSPLPGPATACPPSLSIPTAPPPPSSNSTLPKRNQPASQQHPLTMAADSVNTLPHPPRSNVVSPPAVRNNVASPTTVRMSPTTSMLQSQLSQMQKKKEERHNQPPVSSEEVPPPPTPQTLRRTISCVQPHLRARLGSATPTFNELQFKYGVHGASPVSDRDYQKEARNTVVGELTSFGGVQQASKISGPRKKPSQSPSMRLLGMLHVHDDPEEPIGEGTGLSQEYSGDQGRFLPPRRTIPTPASQGGPYQRSLSSQL